MVKVSAATNPAPSPVAPTDPAPRRFILANPHSFRMASRNRTQRILELAQSSGTPLYAVHGPIEIAAALAEIAPQPADQLIIVGGDGTLQAAVSELAGLAHRGEAPKLAMLGGGRTNFTARDLGSHDRLLGSMSKLLDQPDSWRTVDRPVLRISGSEHGDLYGFFVAGALVDAIIRDCHAFRSKGRSRLTTGLAATPLRLAQLGLAGLFGRARFPLPKVRLEAPELGEIEGKLRILLLTSLAHTSGALNPYAPRGQGNVRLTAIRKDARGFWRRLPGLLVGRLGDQAGPDQGYLSGNTSEVRLTGLPSICLDGQEYSLDPHRALTVQTGPVFRFLQP